MSGERFVLTYGDLVDFLRHSARGLRALERAEKIAARDAERLRVAENRIKNATARLRAAILVMGIGDTRQTDREVRGALENLTAEYPEVLPEFFFPKPEQCRECPHPVHPPGYCSEPGITCLCTAIAR